MYDYSKAQQKNENLFVISFAQHFFKPRLYIIEGYVWFFFASW